MKKVLIFMLISGFCFSQKNPSEWMKKSYEKFYSFDNIKINFEYSIDKKQEVNNNNIDGSILFKKNRYRAFLGNIEQIFDEKNIYTIMLKEKEINITSPEEDGFLTPQKIFSKYNENYKLDLDISQNTPKGKVQFIKLTPKIGKSKTKFLYIGINSSDYSIHKIIEISKNGTTATLNIREIITNQNIDDSIFSFNKKKYETEGFMINDLNF